MSTARLLDIAPTPQEVVVPPRTAANARRALRDRLDGALALVSGRTIAELDEFFAPLRLAAVGGHGAEMRPVADGAVIVRPRGSARSEFKQRLKDIAARHPGVLVGGQGLFDRAALPAGAQAGRCASSMTSSTPIEAWADQSFELLIGQSGARNQICRPSTRAPAVRELMTYPPFAGRAPIFVGDDHTDEDAFKVMPEFNGQAMSVGRKLPGHRRIFRVPGRRARWLGRCRCEAVCHDEPTCRGGTTLARSGA